MKKIILSIAGLGMVQMVSALLQRPVDQGPRLNVILSVQLQKRRRGLAHNLLVTPVTYHLQKGINRFLRRDESGDAGAIEMVAGRDGRRPSHPATEYIAR